MSELVEFLRARIEQRKAVAQKAAKGPWSKILESWNVGDAWAITRPRSPGEKEYPTYEVVGGGYMPGGVWEEADADHIALNDPQDTIARCDAELAILALHVPGRSGECVICDAGAGSCGCVGWGDYPCDTLKLLAAAYADHGDYQEIWRV